MVHNNRESAWAHKQAQARRENAQAQRYAERGTEAHIHRESAYAQRRAQDNERMLKRYIVAMLVLVAIGLALVTGIAYQRKRDTTSDKVYEVEARVICHRDDETVLKDFNGDVWTIDRDDHLQPHAEVTIVLHSQGTSTPEDDIIEEVFER
jgi:hypothetical protein